MGRYVKKHIYGERISDVFKMIGKKMFGNTVWKRQKKLPRRRPKKLFRPLLLRLVNVLAKKQAIKLFSY